MEVLTTLKEKGFLIKSEKSERGQSWIMEVNIKENGLKGLNKEMGKDS